MCRTCMANAKELIRDIIPGYTLVVGQEQVDYAVSQFGTNYVPDLWPAGDYGLVRGGNDPVFIFGAPIVPMPYGNEDGPENDEDWTKADGEQMVAHLEYTSLNRRKFDCDPREGWFFVSALIQAGYTAKDGDPVIWFLNYAYEAIKKAEEKEA